MSKYYQLETIAKVIKPQLVNGVWRKPKLSARRVARIRKECLRYGTINGVQASTFLRIQLRESRVGPRMGQTQEVLDSASAKRSRVRPGAAR